MNNISILQGDSKYGDDYLEFRDGVKVEKNKSVKNLKCFKNTLKFCSNLTPSLNREFRLFLQTLRATFEFYQAFNVIDVEGDHRISKEEFCNEDIK